MAVESSRGKKPIQKSKKTRKYEIRDRFFHLEPLVTKPSLIEIPSDETIVGIETVLGSTTRITVYTVKDVTNAD